MSQRIARIFRGKDYKKDPSSWKINYCFWKPQLLLIFYIEGMRNDCPVLELLSTGQCTLY